MDANYDDVDLVSAGDGDIVKLAGVNGTSANTTRTGTPLAPADLKYLFADNNGEIEVDFELDKLSKGAIIVTFVDPAIVVTKTGPLQLTVDMKGTIINIDLSTTINTIIQNQTEGTKVNSVVGLYNPNGLSPLGSPKPITIPR